MATYYRLFIPEKLNLEKALYLDADIVVNGSIEDLYNTDVSESYLAGVVCPGFDRHEQLEMAKDAQYFNAGVMGCRRRVISGLNWVFSQVEEAIILEDDCLPDLSFFPFCSEMLERYRDQCQLGMVAGFNSLDEDYPFDYSYFFTSAVPIWGWATWRRSWQQYDEHLQNWPEVKRSGVLNLRLPSQRMSTYWTRVFDSMYEGTGPNTWDYQWTYTCWTQNWLNILPAKNLVENIGFGKDATHTTSGDLAPALRAEPLQFPLKHPPNIVPWAKHSLTFHVRP